MPVQNYGVLKAHPVEARKGLTQRLPTDANGHRQG